MASYFGILTGCARLAKAWLTRLGPTPADERHRITFSGLINLKWGITVTPIMQWATGRPYNATEGITDVFGYGSGVGTTHAIVPNSAPNNLTATASYTAAQLTACIAADTCHQVPYPSRVNLARDSVSKAAA